MHFVYYECLHQFVLFRINLQVNLSVILWRLLRSAAFLTNISQIACILLSIVTVWDYLAIIKLSFNSFFGFVVRMDYGGMYSSGFLLYVDEIYSFLYSLFILLIIDCVLIITYTLLETGNNRLLQSKNSLSRR